MKNGTVSKHCIHMEQPVWDQAKQTASSLGLSTSQFLSRLVAETSGHIDRGALLGRLVASRRKSKPQHPMKNAATIALLAVLIFGAASWSLNAQITVGGNGANTTDTNNYSGAQSLTKTGSNTVTLAGTNTYTGTTTVSRGALEVTGSTTGSGLTTISAAGGAVLAVNGGTFSAAAGTVDYNTTIGIGTTAGQSGALRITSGSLSATKQLQVGGNGGYGYYGQSGGTASIGGFLALGLSAGTASVFDQSGGSFSVNGAPITIGATAANTTSSVNLSGNASFNHTSTGSGKGFYIGESGTGVVNVSGSSTLTVAGGNVDGVILGLNSGSTGFLNLSGTVVAPKISKGAGSGTIYFNGGTLQANASTNAFLTGLTGAYVAAGGGTINNGGNNITIGQTLASVTGSGLQSVSLSSGGSGYIGAPNVKITGGSGSGAAGYAQFDASTGTVTNIVITSRGTGYASNDVLTVTLTGGGATSAAAVGSVTLGANTSGGLTFAGTGTTTLTANNTYTGGTLISGGTLWLGAGNTTGSLGSGAITNNATLMIDRYTTAFTVGNTISGTGSVIKRGGATMTLTAANTFGGDFQQWSGVTVLSNTGGAGLFANGSPGRVSIANELGGATYYYSAVVMGAANQLGTNVDVSFQPRNVANGYSYLVLQGNNTTIGNLSSTTNYASAWGIVENQETGTYGNSRLTVNQTTNSTFVGEFRNGYGTTVGTLGLTKNGAATLTLTGAAGSADGINYSGTTLVNEGTLKLANATGFRSATTVAAGALLEVAPTGAQTITSTISGAGSLVKSAAGTLTFSGTQTYTGDTYVTGGTLALTAPEPGGGGSAIASTNFRVSSGGTVSLGTSVPIGWANDKVFFLNGGKVDIANGGYAYVKTLQMDNGAEFALGTGVSTYNPNAANYALTTVTTSSNSTSASSITTRGGVLYGSTTYNIARGNFTGGEGDLISSAVTADNGATPNTLTKNGSGTMVLKGANTYTGGTAVNEGTLVLGSGGSLANNTANTLTVGSGATVIVARNDFLGNHNTTINMPIVVNEGGLFQNSGAVFNSLGAITLNGGTLKANAVEAVSGQSFALKGTVTVNGSATSTIAGNGIALGAGSVTGTTFVVNDGAAATDLNVIGVLRNGAGTSWPTNQASSLTKNGAGVMVLAGDNTYTGVTTINGGTLALDKAAGAQLYKTGAYFGLAGAVTVNTGGTFQSWNWEYGANNALSELQANYTALVVNGGRVVLNDTFASGRGFTVGANGATLETTAGNTFTKTANANDQDLIRFTTNSTLTVAGAGNTVINDKLGSFGATGFSIVKNGTGQLTLGGSNSYTGGTTVNAGKLATSGSQRLADGGAVTVNSDGTFAIGGDETIGTLAGSGAVTLAGRLTTGASDSTYSGVMSGNGGLTKAGAGTFTLGGASTYVGDTVLSGGTLVLNNANALWNGGVLSMGAGTTLTVNQRTFIGALDQGSGTVNGPGELVATLTLTESGALNAVLADGPDFAAGILKRTGGTTTIGAANTFTGAINVQGGTLQLAAGGSFDAASSLALSAGATMDLNNKAQTFAAVQGAGGTVALGSGSLTVNNAADNSFGGAITGSGSVTKTGAGVLELGGTNTYSGGTVVSAGTVSGNTASLQGAITNDASVVFNQSSDGTYAGNLTGSGSLTKADTGKVILTGANSQAGTTIAEGTLQVGNGGTTGSLSGNITNNAALAFNRSDNVTQSGVISGSGSVTKDGAGTTTLSGANTYSGGTTVNAGALRGTTASVQGAITNNASVIFDQSGNGTYAGTMSGSGAVTKSGAGVVELTATGTYSGATTVSSGGLLVNGAIESSTVTVQNGAFVAGSGSLGGLILQSGSTLSPGNSPGTLSVNGNASWLGGANFNLQITDAAGSAGTSWDLLSATGTLDLSALNLGNQFNINLWSLSSTGPDVNGAASNFNANQNYSWTIAIASGGITGYTGSSQFNINTAAFNGTGGFANSLGGGSFSVAQDGNNLNLVFTAGASPEAVPEPGTWAAAALLACGAGYMRWRKRRQAQQPGQPAAAGTPEAHRGE